MRDNTNDTPELTRNKILAGIGAIGTAGAGAGIGTSALFSDNEQLTNNELTAGTLNLTVSASVVETSEYFTSSGSGPDIVGNLGTADGAVVTGLQIKDFKPGDWVVLCLELSVEDNPGYIQFSADNFAQYENGQTEPEADVDDSTGGSLGLPLDGLGQGELQDELRVEVYDEYDSQSGGNPPQSYLRGEDNRLSGTAKEVFDRLADGAFLGGQSTPTEVGPANSPVKRYFLLELPTTVGNEVQSDTVMFDLVFETEQARHNEISAATRTVTEQKLAPGDETTVTISMDVSEEVDLDVFERFDTGLGTASFKKATVDGETVVPSFVDLGEGGGIMLFDGISSGSLSVEYSLSVATDPPTGTVSFQPNLVDVNGQAVPLDNIDAIEVIT